MCIRDRYIKAVCPEECLAGGRLVRWKTGDCKGQGTCPGADDLWDGKRSYQLSLIHICGR